MTDYRKLVKIATAGSVDDGKSTLIGRLLYDTQSLPADKLEAIRNSSRQRGYDYLDLSLATDGLVAEREQGITIDVAHIFFSTRSTNFIIADTPGHIEYTRNMVTGASTSQAAIILVDARKGVTEQTYRHFFINDLLNTEHIIVAVNKMDLVGYEENTFRQIKADVMQLVAKSNFTEEQITFIPVSALKGDNVTANSEHMPWYRGAHLLEYLEGLKFEKNETLPMRFPVQYVIRPKTEDFHDFRGFAGKIYGNKLEVGERVTVLPSGTETGIRSVMVYDKEYDAAAAGSSVVITLEDEVDISRGDMLVKTGELMPLNKEITAVVCQVNNRALRLGMKVILQHGVNRVLAKVDTIHYKIHPDYSGTTATEELKLNDIGLVGLKLSKPVYADVYKKNKTNGSFILIDENTFDTVSVGFIEG